MTLRAHPLRRLCLSLSLRHRRIPLGRMDLCLAGPRAAPRARNGVRDNAQTPFHLLMTHPIVDDVAINAQSARPALVAFVPADQGTVPAWDSVSTAQPSLAITRTAAVAGTPAVLARAVSEALARKPGPSASRKSPWPDRASCKTSWHQCNMDRT
jgi:hypothetical protein